MKRLKSNTIAPQVDISVPSEAPLPPAVLDTSSEVDIIRPTAPTASQFTDRILVTLTTTGSTIVAPELEPVPSTGSAPPYWRSREKGGSSGSVNGWLRDSIDRKARAQWRLW